MRKVFIGGNWKSNGTLSFVKSHFENVLNKLDFDTNKCEVIVSPLSIHLSKALELSNNKVQIASQNLSLTKEGAFTGEISAKALKDLGLKWTIIGHSERRTLYGESSEIVAEKVIRAEEESLNSILCIGETKDERQANKTFNVIFHQLNAVKNLKPKWENIVIAYEPVWAIGTGITASPEEAQEVHQKIREWLSSEISSKAEKETRIIYGGSVTEKNAKDLITKKDIDGFLVGGASLKPAFAEIVNSYRNKNH